MNFDFLKDLKEDVRFYLGDRYYLKRYSYWEKGKDNWVDENDKKITERMFSFVLERNNIWDNATHRNFRESRLDEVIGTYQKILSEKQTERREFLTKERAERKLYPQLIQYKFNDCTISVYTKFHYVNKYPVFGRKEVYIYKDGFPFQFCEPIIFDKEKVIDLNKTLHILAQPYCDVISTNRRNMTEFFEKKHLFVKKEIIKINDNYSKL